ncbi:MAG: ATP-binding cassette domain-containing protein [Lactobacillales bacterium]|jgi:ATP-binding cassette subfamily F protein 3|nr:ATP-binding cassette domain-containing protein [Lactobacillales bacterium]
MIILQTNKLGLEIAGETILRDVTFSVNHNDRIAVVGRNGAGKTTLLNLLLGPDVQKKRDLNIAYLNQNPIFDDDTNTVESEARSVFTELLAAKARLDRLAENLETPEAIESFAKLSDEFSARGGYEIDTRIKMILNGFQFPESSWGKAVGDLSGGEKTRLSFAKILLDSPELLILDEPTNHLDIDTLNWLERYLKNYDGAIIIVSHDRYFLDKVTTSTIEIANKTAVRYNGNYSKYLVLKAQKLTEEINAYKKQQKTISSYNDFIARNMVRASTTKRAQSRLKALNKIEVMDKPSTYEKSINFNFLISKPSGNEVLKVADLAVGHDGLKLNEHLDFDIYKGDSVALIGPNGIGKTTLIKTLLGQLPALAGTFKLGANLEVGYYDQEQSTLNMTKSVYDEISDAFPSLNETPIRNLLGGLLFSGDDIKKTISLLSGGEKARVALAKLALSHDNFLLLDEPTNHLDMESKSILENALIDFEGTTLFISHDRYFINRTATKVLELGVGGLKMYEGNYDFYIEEKAKEQDAAGESNAGPSEQAQDYKRSKEGARLARNLSRQIDDIELRMAELDELVSVKEAALYEVDPTDSYLLSQIQREIDEAREQSLTLGEKWEELSLELENLDV